MHVRVIESRQQQFAGSIDQFGCRPAPCVDIDVRTHRNNAIPKNRDRLGGGMAFVHRPDFGVANDEVGSGSRLCPQTRRHNKGQEQLTNATVRRVPQSGAVFILSGLALRVRGLRSKAELIGE